MIRLNLMPWRQDLRQQKNREFFTVCSLFVVVAVGLIVILNFFLDLQIDEQKQRNAYLQGKLDELDKEIENIKRIESQKASLISSMTIISKLETSRPRSIHLLEQLVLTLPNGMWLEKVTQSGDSIEVEAKTTDSSLISTYLRNIDQSFWFGGVVLDTIRRPEDDEIATLGLRFNLSNTQPAQNESSGL
ncbi:MAG: PilN domain-containing protein [Gammaproteobacteria bacterium]|nr:PilN domain-containing protein [Pseudomonadota bacterium]MCH9663537.1 PilN domain-containing protein [Gammaproteobacteria bacterium]